LGIVLSQFKCKNAGVAQLVEQLICNQLVGGSSPFFGSFLGQYQSGQMGQTVNLLTSSSVVRIHLAPHGLTDLGSQIQRVTAGILLLSF